MNFALCTTSFVHVMSTLHGDGCEKLKVHYYIDIDVLIIILPNHS
jgi:hypothetical protein